MKKMLLFAALLSLPLNAGWNDYLIPFSLSSIRKTISSTYSTYGQPIFNKVSEKMSFLSPMQWGILGGISVTALTGYFFNKKIAAKKKRIEIAAEEERIENEIRRKKSIKNNTPLDENTIRIYSLYEILKDSKNLADNDPLGLFLKGKIFELPMVKGPLTALENRITEAPGIKYRLESAIDQSHDHTTIDKLFAELDTCESKVSNKDEIDLEMLETVEGYPTTVYKYFIKLQRGLDHSNNKVLTFNLGKRVKNESNKLTKEMYNNIIMVTINTKENTFSTSTLNQNNACQSSDITCSFYRFFSFRKSTGKKVSFAEDTEKPENIITKFNDTTLFLNDNPKAK